MAARVDARPSTGQSAFSGQPTTSNPQPAPFFSAPPTPTTNVSPTSPLSSTHKVPSSASAHRARAQPSVQPSAQRVSHRHARSPLYVPAVLRPTLGPGQQRQSPLNSPNKSSDQSESSTAVGSLLWADGGWKQVLQGGCTAPVSRVVGDEWNDHAMSQVTGPPTRNHWKPDTCTDTCQSPTHSPPSTGTFTFFRRRHHCRRCGNIFCGVHAVNMVPLDQHARFHSKGSLQRACDSCWADYGMWSSAMAERASRSSEGDTSGGKGQDKQAALLPPGSAYAAGGLQANASGSNTNSSSSPLASIGSGSRPITAATQLNDVPPAAAAASVPRDWNWSTF